MDENLPDLTHGVSLSFIVFIRYREFNPRFVHDVHEVFYFLRVHRTTKCRDRHHKYREYLQPFAFHRHKFLQPSLGNRVNVRVDATRPAGVAVLCGTGAASWRLDAARSYRAGGGRGEKAGSVKACCGRFWSLTRGRRTNTAIAIKNRRITRTARGRLAALGVSAASNTTARQKKAARRRKEESSRILRKSYAEGLSAQTVSHSVVFSCAGHASVPATTDLIW